MAVNKLIWYEEPWLKCMVSLDPSSPGVSFFIYDEKGNEFEITAPRYSFNVNPAGTSSTPTLQSGVTVSGGTEYFGGMANIGGTVSDGTSVNLSTYSSGNSGPGWH